MMFGPSYGYADSGLSIDGRSRARHAMAMPLPKSQTNWLARLVVLLICAAIVGLFIPIVWLLNALHVREWLIYPVLSLWLVMVVLSILWTIAVWAPEREKKIVKCVLRTPWSF